MHTISSVTAQHGGHSKMALTQIPVTTINSTNVVPVINASPQANTTGNITTSTTTITATDMSGVGSVSVQISGTYAGVNVTFEATVDGTNWISIPALQIGSIGTAPSPISGVLTGNSLNVYNVSPLLGVTQFRVRATAYTSGSAAVIIRPSTQFVQYSSYIGGVGTVALIQSITPGTTNVSLGKAEDAVHATGDTGIFSLAVRNDNAASVVTSATQDYSQVSVDDRGTTFTRYSPSTVANKTNVAAAATSTTLLAANAARRTAVLVNESTVDCYISYGGTASITSYTFLLPSQGTTTILGSEWAGAIVGIWASATGNCRVTETLV